MDSAAEVWRSPAAGPSPAGERSPWLLFALLSSLVYLSSDVSGALVDNFHEGELLGFVWHLRRYYVGAAPFPLLVHGAMDYVPALLASQVFGQDSGIVGTRVVLVLLSALQGFLFLDLGRSLVAPRKGATAWLLLLAGWFWYCAPQLNGPVVTAAYFPVRDVFLTLSLWSFARYARGVAGHRTWSLLVLGAAAAVAAFFWCYNRGLMAVGFLGVFLLGLLVRRRPAAAATVAVAAFACLGLAEATRVCGTLGENAANIAYWATRGSEVNYLRFEFRYLPGLAGLALLFTFAAAVLYVWLWARRRVELESDLLVFVAAGLFLVQALSLHAVVGVPISEYALHAGWPSALLLVLCASRLLEIEMPRWRPRFSLSGSGEEGMPPRALALATAVLVVFLLVCQKNAFFAYVRFAKNLVVPVPNEQVAPQDVLDVAKFLSATDDPCFFNWTNDGVVAFLARKSLCTGFPYVHYAGRPSQGALIAQLEAAPPEYVVKGGYLWPVTRHDEPTEERLPLVAAYLDAHYESARELGRYRVNVRQLPR